MNDSAQDRSSAIQEISVACAADDNYMMPLGVMLRSTAENLQPQTRLSVYIMDGGVSDSNKRMLEDTLSPFTVELIWIQYDFSAVKEFMISHHVSHVAYYRLMIADALPDYVDKVLYLDCDMLVKDDVGKLWDLDLQDEFCKAVPDIACPFVYAHAHPETKSSWPYLASLNPIRNFRELGIDEKAKYFNSGLMLINLRKWREEYISTQFLTCLEENHKNVWCWDQYALNAVMAGKWGELPMVWNQGANIFEFPSLSHGPVDVEKCRAVRENPSIVHFTTEWKPWHYTSTHPLQQDFFDAIDRTAWHGWRPEKPDFTIKRWWHFKALNIQKKAAITYRKVASILT